MAQLNTIVKSNSCLGLERFLRVRGTYARGIFSGLALGTSNTCHQAKST
jgi:hypothetical protein